MKLNHIIIAFFLSLVLFTPTFAATLTVTNCADSGAGSLRQAVTSVGNGDTINFDITLAKAGYSTGEAGPGLVTTEAGSDRWFRIVLNSAMPWITANGVRITGLTQAHEATNTLGPKVEVRQAVSGGWAQIFYILNSNYVTIEGLALNKRGSGAGFGPAIYLCESNYCRVRGCYLGITASGEALPLRSYYGIYLYAGSNPCSNNVIGDGTAAGRNIISGNDQYGVLIQSGGSVKAANNVIIGNYIGTDRTGLNSLSNLDSGVRIDDARFNKIGNGTDAGRNVISGNQQYGVNLDNQSTSNEVSGNYIGVDVSGGTALGNASAGIMIQYSSAFNRIGGTTAGSRNVISGNSIGYGIEIENSASSNEVLGNYVGLDATGTTALNNFHGIVISYPAPRNWIGNGTVAGRNVISGNSGCGITISASSEYVLSNYIGTDKDGGTAIGNSFAGVSLSGGNNCIGLAGAGNVISGNGRGIISADGSNNYVLSNYIGLKANGTDKLPNADSGIELYSAANTMHIGDGTADSRNIISGNSLNGIFIHDVTSTDHVIANNYIGTDYTGANNLGNTEYGVLIQNSPDIHVQEGSIVAFNGDATHTAGVRIDGLTASGEAISSSPIFGNYGQGIFLSGGANNSVTTPEIIATDYNQPTGELKLRLKGDPWAYFDVFAAAGSQGKIFLNNTNIQADATGYATPTVTTSALQPGDRLIATQFSLLNSKWNTSQFGASREVYFSALATYQPDVQVATLESGADYATAGGYESTPITQVRSIQVGTGETGVAFIKLENTGNSKEMFFFTATASGSGFTVKYFDSKHGGNDITSLLLTPSFAAIFNSGVSTEIRAEVTYGGVTAATKEIVVTMTSTTDATKTDAVKAVITFVPGGFTTTTASREYNAAQLGIPGMSISIPAGASATDPVISVTEVTTPGAAPVGYKIGGKVINILSSVTTFSLPVTVTIPTDGPLADPRVYYWNGSTWSRDGITVVSYTNTSITFTTTHFTVFTSMGVLPTNLVRFGPNPYNPNSGVMAKIWYWLDANAETSVYVVDLAGTVVLKTTYAAGAAGGSAGANNLDFDGKDKWGQVLGDGVYLYKIVQGGKVIGGGKIGIVK